jgi:hypothetical protein
MKEEKKRSLKMKKIIITSILICILALGVNSARADSFTFTGDPVPFGWSFELLPTAKINGAQGETIGWGYSITNKDPINFLCVNNIGSDTLFENVDVSAMGGAGVFDLPIVNPKTTWTIIYTYWAPDIKPDPLDPSKTIMIINSTGLYEITWANSAPNGFENKGNFELSTSWLDQGSNRINDRDFVMTASYSATVAPVPEPATLVLMGFGSSFLGIGIKRLRKKLRKTK